MDINNLNLKDQGIFKTVVSGVRHLILSKVHLIITIPILTAGAYFIYIMKETGKLDKFETFMTNSMNVIVNISKTCTYYIPDMHRFLDCVDKF